MNLRRALAAPLLGLTIAAVAPVSAASAAPAYPPVVSVSITLSASVVTVGGSVTITGRGFRANAAVSVTTTRTGQGFAGAVGRSDALGSFRPLAAAPVQGFAAPVRTDDSGAFSTRVSFSQVGAYTVTASGPTAAGGVESASAGVLVVAAGGGVGGDGSGDGAGAGSGSGSGSGSASGGGGASGVGGLPNTGSSIGLPVTLGSLLVLAGAALVAVVRRRRGHAAA